VFKMRDVSRHKSMDVLQGYVRDADIFVYNELQSLTRWLPFPALSVRTHSASNFLSTLPRRGSTNLIVHALSTR
jgi:hypothetical protein